MNEIIYILEEIIKILSVVFLSAFKLVVGGPLAVVYGYSFIETIVIMSIGGIMGVIIFTYFNRWVIALWRKYIKKPGRKKKIFTNRNKLIVRVKRRYGIIGVSFIAPLLTIPIGTFVLVRYFHNRRKIIIYASISVVFWSIMTAILVFFPKLL